MYSVLIKVCVVIVSSVMYNTKSSHVLCKKILRYVGDYSAHVGL